MNKTFFIVGSQRSGTTLTGLILDSHPDVIVYQENESYERTSSGTFPKDRLTGFKIPAWTFRYQFLEDTYPQSKYIFLKRDIKSIACSMCSLTFGDKKWIELYGIQQTENSIVGVTHLSIKKKFQEILQELRKNNNVVLLSVLTAYVKIYLFEEYKMAHLDVLPVKYEELISNPKKKIEEILTFLQVSWDEAVLAHHAIHHVNWDTWSGAQVSRPIDKRSLEKWKHFFTEQEVADIDRFILYINKVTTSLTRPWAV